MDDTRTMNVEIPFNTWGPKRRLIQAQVLQLRADDVSYAEGLLQRLQRVLLMVRGAVLDLIRVR